MSSLRAIRVGARLIWRFQRGEGVAEAAGSPRFVMARTDFSSRI
jgi:hypothetical protein